MSAKTISVDLDSSNLLWLQAQALASGRRTVSDVLNDIVARTRKLRQPASAERSEHSETRSVVGLASISEDDPGLESADAAIRSLFDESVSRFPSESERG